MTNSRPTRIPLPGGSSARAQIQRLMDLKNRIDRLKPCTCPRDCPGRILGTLSTSIDEDLHRNNLSSHNGHNKGGTGKDSMKRVDKTIAQGSHETPTNKPTTRAYTKSHGGATDVDMVSLPPTTSSSFDTARFTNGSSSEATKTPHTASYVYGPRMKPPTKTNSDSSSSMDSEKTYSPSSGS